MHPQFVYCGVVKLFDGCLFEHLVGDFHLPVCPWVPELCRAMINLQRLTGLIKRVSMLWSEVFCQQVIGKLCAIVRQNMGNFEEAISLQVEVV